MSTINISAAPRPLQETPTTSGPTVQYELSNQATTEVRSVKAGEVVVVENTPLLATKSSTTQNTRTILMWLGVILVVIIIFAVVALAIYWSTRPTKVNVVCATQADCAPGNYCSSSGICLAGAGATSGTLCAKSDDCRFGLSCFEGRCGTELSVPLVSACSPLTPPAKFRLKTTIGGNSYYVNISSTGSVLQTAVPTEYMTYSPATEILSVNPNNQGGVVTPVGVISSSTGHNGEMYTTGGAERFICISGTHSAAKLVLDCGSVAQYAGTSAAPTAVHFTSVPATLLSQNCTSFPSPVSGKDLTFILEEVV